jgi:hypothetical protein
MRKANVHVSFHVFLVMAGATCLFFERPFGLRGNGLLVSKGLDCSSGLLTASKLVVGANRSIGLRPRGGNVQTMSHTEGILEGE